MATDFKSIPIIDVSPLLAKCDDPKMGADPGVCRVVKQLDQACREAGFFYVKGHDIPESLFNEVKNISHEFFDLPYKEKIKIKLTPTVGYRGYATIGENITNGKPDMHEGIICYKEFKKGMYGALGKPMEGCNQWPLNPPNFKSSMEEYINLCTDLSRNIIRGIALALGGSPYEFEGERAGDPFWVLRIIGYPGVSFSDGQEHDLGCGAHTDYGLLTLINQTLINQEDNITALQVRNQSEEWIPAPPIPGSFICNIGDLLEIFSNGLYESPMHRVVNSSPKYRVSLPYFYETNYDIVVEPLDICKHRSGAGTAKYGKTVYGERLVNKVRNNFAV